MPPDSGMTSLRYGAIHSAMSVESALTVAGTVTLVSVGALEGSVG